MIICRTPFRISFFGGGTDYPAWYREHGGAVLATTIDKYCYITCRVLPPFFAYRTRLLYSKVETVNRASEVRHPAVRACLEYLNVTEGLEIHHDADLPARTGIGSSSTFTVGMLHTLYALRGRMPAKIDLARDAFHVEHEILKETVGVQDQTLAAYGGFCRIDLGPEDGIDVHPVVLPPARLEAFQAHLLLVFTGLTRVASRIAAEQVKGLARRASQFAALRASVDEAQRILSGEGDLSELGRLLHESWQVKKSLSRRVSSALIDGWYDAARSAGAIGGKILGAGGGGFLLFYAPPDAHDRIAVRLGLVRVPFRFEGRGSQIIFCEPDSNAA